MSVQSVGSQMIDQIVLTDPRMHGKVRYPLLPTIFAIIIAWCGGCNNCKNVELFWHFNLEKLRTCIPGLPEFYISHDTVNRLLRTIVFDELHSFLREFVQRAVETEPDFMAETYSSLVKYGQEREAEIRFFPLLRKL